MILADLLQGFQVRSANDCYGLFLVSLSGTSSPGINRVRFRIFDLCSFPCRVGIRPA